MKFKSKYIKRYKKRVLTKIEVYVKFEKFASNFVLCGRIGLMHVVA